MPSAPKPPAPINVAQTTANAQEANLTGAQQGQALSTIGQTNPIGNLTYTTTIDPITGLPKYQANESYTPEQQAIFEQLQRNQTGVGGTAGSAISNLFAQYGQDPNLVGQAGSLTNQALDAQMPAWERFDAPARAQLDTQLRNQGILPGTPAYQQQVDALTNQQGLTRGSWLSNFQPQAFQEAQSQYQLPLQNVLSMMGISQPGNINQNLANTPGANVNPVDVAGLTTEAQQEAYRNYQQQVARQNAMMGMGTGIVGGILGMPVNPVGGGSLGMSMINGLMGGGSRGAAG